MFQPLKYLWLVLKSPQCRVSAECRGFRANGYRLLLHVVAYGLVVLFREAVSVVQEVGCATVSTLRTRLWQVAAVVSRSAQGLCFHVSAQWPGRPLWCRIQSAVDRFVSALAGRATGHPSGGGSVGLSASG